MLAALHESAAHNGRGAKQVQQQKGVAAEVADQPEILLAARARKRPVVVNARNGLHAPPVAVPQPHAIDALGAAHVAGAVVAQRNHFIRRQLAGHTAGPQHLIAQRRHFGIHHLVNLPQLIQASLHAAMRARDQLRLRLAEIRGDVRVRERRAKRRRMRRERQRAIWRSAQAFFLQPAPHARQGLGRQGRQAAQKQITGCVHVVKPRGRSMAKEGNTRPLRGRAAFLRLSRVCSWPAHARSTLSYPIRVDARA